MPHELKVKQSTEEKSSVALPSSVIRALSTACSLLSPGCLLLVGELHGNRQMPQAFCSIVDHVVMNGNHAVVHLEIPFEYDQEFSRFLTGEHSAKVLVSSEFWMNDGYGRATSSVLQLLIRLRDLKALYPRLISVSLFDTKSDGRFTQIRREHAMYCNISQVVKDRPDDVHLIFAGNIHAQTRYCASIEFFPAGVRLKNSFSNTTSIVLAHDGGTTRAVFYENKQMAATGCTPHVAQLGQMRLNTTHPGDFVSLDTSYPWDWAFNVGQITASAPARLRIN